LRFSWSGSLLKKALDFACLQFKTAMSALQDPKTHFGISLFENRGNRQKRPQSEPPSRVDKCDTLRMKTASLGLPPRFLALIAFGFASVGRRERSLCSL
jgi:hypothetical protein